MIEFGVGCSLAAIIVLVVNGFIRAHRYRLTQLRLLRSQFFEQANQLIANDSLTDDQLAALRQMADGLDEARSLSVLRGAVATVDREMRSGRYVPSARVASQEWCALLFSYFLALTYVRFIEGWWVRAMLTTMMNPLVSARNTETLGQMVRDTRLQTA